MYWVEPDMSVEISAEAMEDLEPSEVQPKEGGLGENGAGHLLIRVRLPRLCVPTHRARRRAALRGRTPGKVAKLVRGYVTEMEWELTEAVKVGEFEGAGEGEGKRVEGMTTMTRLAYLIAQPAALYLRLSQSHTSRFISWPVFHSIRSPFDYGLSPGCFLYFDSPMSFGMADDVLIRLQFVSRHISQSTIRTPAGRKSVAHLQCITSILVPGEDGVDFGSDSRYFDAATTEHFATYCGTTIPFVDLARLPLMNAISCLLSALKEINTDEFVFTAAAVRTYKAVFERVAETISEQLENSPAAVLRYFTQDLSEDFVAKQPLGHMAVGSENMGENEVIAQVGVLLLAGQETTIRANTIAFALLELARHSDFPEKLREEIHSALGISQGAVPYDSATWDNYRKVIMLLHQFPAGDRTVEWFQFKPQVDGVRYGAPIDWAFSQLPRHQSAPKRRGKRTIGKDLKAQMKVTDFNRLCLEHVFSSGRDNISVVLQVKARNYLGFDVAEESASFETQGPRGPTPGYAGGVDTLEPRWGKDVHEFNPSRWLDGTVSAGDAVGPYANLWRFMIPEIQVILCELVSTFSVAQAEGESIEPRFPNNLMLVVSSGEETVPLHVTQL
ncbi:hypothetical protein DFH08DRAFT_825105 [Mycena albidolilacea]|uniref:Cytochrome P450 n=1 Tax=Mycena albidolilacea TaxID=1033008 RepID=A0AAD7EAA5_9AGAR|nr:hypothetical protein DFH08DRAFT_825105 [Mycena albidolilacea]